MGYRSLGHQIICILLVEKLLVKKTKKTQKTLLVYICAGKSKSKNNSKLIDIEALSLQELFLMQCDKDKDRRV
uniref:Uncharacterized protein n=1 Tax=Rhizophagus irregularis (strain DAOM 181602 / DAOM 197198 / MUCL 43194) TaxID=747089 RepID=U9UWF6_RHIID